MSDEKYIQGSVLSQVEQLHAGRRTFSITVILSQGVPIETVSKMLGHTNIKTTQIYARITEEEISHDMEILSRKLEPLERQVPERI